jgi:hypothetical protein
MHVETTCARRQTAGLRGDAVSVCRSFPRVDEILAPYSAALGNDGAGYRNHVSRLLNFYTGLARPAAGLPEAVLVAAAFHDLGIWADHTFDYLEPSVRRASEWLSKVGLAALEPEVARIIREHHKLRPYTGEFAGSVEAFRKADLVDVSLGLVRFGLDRGFIREVRAAFPNRGFHARLAQLTARQLLRTPRRPLPMMHW